MLVSILLNIWYPSMLMAGNIHWKHAGGQKYLLKVHGQKYLLKACRWPEIPADSCQRYPLKACWWHAGDQKCPLKACWWPEVSTESMLVARNTRWQLPEISTESMLMACWWPEMSAESTLVARNMHWKHAGGQKYPLKASTVKTIGLNDPHLITWVQVTKINMGHFNLILFTVCWWPEISTESMLVARNIHWKHAGGQKYPLKAIWWPEISTESSLVSTESMLVAKLIQISTKCILGTRGKVETSIENVYT